MADVEFPAEVVEVDIVVEDVDVEMEVMIGKP